MCVICTGDYRNLDFINCEQCSKLKYIPDIPGLKHLICTGCEKLKRISNITSLIILDCSWCDNLTEIPALPNLESLDCWCCDNITNILNFPQLKKLYCGSCNNLAYIYPSRHLCELNCISCPNLINIPIVASLKELVCSYCPKLTEIPALLNLEILECASINIKGIPHLPILKNIIVDNCRFITDINNNSQDLIIYCNNCPWLDHPQNIDYKNNINKLIQLQKSIKNFLRRKHIKEYLQSEAFVAWYYSPNMPGGRKAKKEIEKIINNVDIM